MKFRYARHTSNLNSLIEFYTNIIGLKKIGAFENHVNYNGVFLGFEKSNWHLEFTSSNANANHNFDDDDLIVFYFNTREEINIILEKAKRQNIKKIISKNPYWQKNGVEIKDPDGFGVILTLDNLDKSLYF